MLAHEHLGCKHVLPFRVKDLNLSLCVICGQIKPNERLVDSPTSLDRVLTCIKEWGSYGHLEYFESWSKLKTFTALKLTRKGASRLRQCSSGIRTPSVGTCIAIAHRFSSKRETARSLYGIAHVSKRTVRESVRLT